MGRVVAKTVAQVIAGEAVHGTRAQRYADMKAIASVIDNRAKSLGVTPQQVVANKKEFNAYGKALPPGASAYVGLASQAVEDVSVNGPIHNATFYATPAAAKNLPKGLVAETQTAGHKFFSDPKARAIGTAVGYRAPDLSALGQTAVAAAPAPANAPAPQFAQRDVGGLLAQSAPLAMGLAPTPKATPAMAALNAALAPSQEANLASRLGPKPASPLSSAQEANLASRLGPVETKTALTEAQEKNLGERLGVAVNTPSTKQALSPDQERNLADRFGDMSPAVEANVTSRLNAAETPAPSMSIGGLLGVNPASAGTLTSPAPVSAPAPAAVSAPASTGFAGPIGSPRSMEATIAGPTAGARYAPAPSAPATISAPAPSAAPAPSIPSAPTNFAGAIGSPRAVEAQSMSALDASNAMGAGMFNKPAPAPVAPAAPAMSPEAALAADVADQRVSQGLPALSQPKTVASPPATYNAPMAASVAPSAPVTSYAPEQPSSPAAPQSIEGAVGQNRQATGLGEPSIPDAPSAFSQATAKIGNALSQNAGKMAGGLLGSAAFGPVGGLVGGLLGQTAQRNMTTQPSPTARALGQAGLIGGLVDGGIGYQQPGGLLGSFFGSMFGGGRTGLGAPGVPGAPTGRAGYSTSSRGSENASQAARDTAGQGLGLY